MKALDPDFKFKYHNNYSCYKGYTDCRNAPDEPNEPDEPEKMDISDNESDVFTPRKPSTRSDVTPRSGPSPRINPRKLPCTVCGQTRKWVNKSYVRKKFKISEPDRAEQFLKAVKCDIKPDVSVHCSDLNSISDILAADVYCHKECIRDFVRETDKHESNSVDFKLKCKTRLDVFNDALPVIDDMIQSGYGLSVSEISDILSENDEALPFTNKQARNLLVAHYGDRIRFTPSHRVNESDLCFSANITFEEISKALRCRDVCQLAGQMISDAFDKDDFKLDDKFCDASEIRDSWENTHMPDELLSFYSALFKIKRSRMFQIKMLDVGESVSNLNRFDGENDDPEQISDEIDWAIKNQHTQLHCLFQQNFYLKYHGLKPIPFAVANGSYQ